ncbi:delta(24)-sterol reductase-like isoform X2 [Cherax quadricarinatus]|uniref:delta(24)-sterol reductase-like isoform X2 n=1 Tax=Cherax quadricarinatus TaxID=27406 RepID=UPI00387EE493
MASTEWLEYILLHYRWVVVVFFLLPASLCFDVYYYTRSWIIFKLNSAPEHHEIRVKDVQRQVREWNINSEAVPMCTARPGWQSISFREAAYKKAFHKIQINMVDILEIDTDEMTVRCEPLVTMGQLTHTLTELGWTIPVVPEMDDLTIGGLVMGTGIETSSHKMGLFQHICVAYELVVADGSVLMCSETENRDLFYSVPWSYGTLGFLTAVKIKIIPAQRFVRVEYKPCYSLDDIVKTFTQETTKVEGNQFVEGVMYSLHSGVVMTANMCTAAHPGQLNKIGRWYKPWFFKHVETYLINHETGVEYFPLRDYYHRHTRSIFWEIQIYPIWLCPFKLPANPGMLHPLNGEEAVFIDIGTYGKPGVPSYEPTHTTRRIEKFVRKHKGFQMMYADSYMTREEYREMFDHSLYDKMRKKLHCERAFPEVYDKVNRKARI